MAKKLDLEDWEDRPSFKQIAERLKDRLYRNDGEPDGLGYGSVLTIPYKAFYGIVERDQLRKRLYTEVELEASRIGLVVAFGWNAVIVATDDDFVPGGWSTFAHQPRPARPVVSAPKRQKLTDDEKRALFSRISKNKRASS